MAGTTPPIPGPDQARRDSSDKRPPSGEPPAPRLIGVAVDGSSSGRDAAVLGSLLARATGAELMLIAVHEEPLLPVALRGGMSWTDLEKQARTMLVQTRDALAPDARITVQADVLVWRGLRHVVRRDHRDLLVIGSARGTDAGLVRLGRSMDDLLGQLECPLAIAPAGFQEQTKNRLDSVGVGFDDTPEARAALELAVSIAKSAGGRLEVRQAIDDGVAGGLKTEQIELEGDAIIGHQLTAAFQRDVAATSGTGVPTNLEVEVGIPADVLCDLGDRVDLLVFGSGRSGRPGRLDLGHTGRAIVGLARCPVVLVPRPAAPSRRGR